MVKAFYTKIIKFNSGNKRQVRQRRIKTEFTPRRISGKSIAELKREFLNSKLPLPIGNPDILTKHNSTVEGKSAS